MNDSIQYSITAATGSIELNACFYIFALSK